MRLRSHDLRASLIRFQRCLGEESRFGAFNKQIDYSNGRRLPRSPQNSKRIRRDLKNAWKKTVAIRSAEPADLFLGHHALDILSLALDAIARAAVRLDRQAGDNGIDAALLDDGAALRTLQLVVDVIINRVIMGHRNSFRWRAAF